MNRQSTPSPGEFTRGEGWVVAQFLLQKGIHLGGSRAPEKRGVPQFGLPVVQPEIDWFWRSAFDHDPVEPGELQLGGEEAATLAVTNAIDEGGLGVGRHPALAGNGRASEW